MLPLLHQYLQAVPASGVPHTIMTTLASGAREYVVWNLHLHNELLRLLAVFNHANIPVMPLKGPWLAGLLYGDVTLRPTGDLDLLVRKEHLAKAERLLRESSYMHGRLREHEGDSYHYTFVRADHYTAPITVELHWDIVRTHIARRDIEEVWSAASRNEWHEREIWTMSTPDLFLILCENAAKDTFGFFKQLVDIGLLIERFGATWSWSALAQTIQAAHLRTRVFLTLCLTHELCDSQVPGDFLTAIRPPQGVSWSVGIRLFRRRGGVLHATRADIGPPLNTILTLLWEDSWRGQLRHLHRLVLPPAGYQARWTALPSSSSAWRWYPLWIGHTIGQALRLLVRMSNRKRQQEVTERGT